MKKTLKSLTALLLALAMVLALAACAKTPETPSTPAATEPAQTEPAKTEPAATEPSKTEPAQTSEPAQTEPTTAEPAVQEEIEIEDMIGRKVKVTPGSYTRVVCIGAGALRMYCYIGSPYWLCGVEDIDNTTLDSRPKMFDSAARPYVLAFGDIFATLPSCGVGGPNAQAAEAEKILACNPDIVISEYEDVEKEDALQAQLGVPVITLKSGSDGVFAEAFAGSMRLLGTIFRETEKAETLISFVDTEAAAIANRTVLVADADKPAVYICGLGNWGTTNHLMTAENYSTFRVANIKNAVSGLGIKGIGAIEAEKFLTVGESTDIMIIDAAAVKNIKPLFKEDPTMFDTVKAWKDGEVYLQMPYNAYYTNYELALANAWFVAKSVYPELFADIDMTAKLNEITQVFLGAEMADKIFACGASFGGYQKIDTATFFN